ncbi:unnamed protein product [Staurois parvus]|uniref:PiggyBac transposable element-derived protein domain-containing protein n=1 Tax=Staurois parvus TaxID=386267 RepID=A0ABN9C8I6_9NEOB|nr:unnamed protein product [Staurois parvus]
MEKRSLLRSGVPGPISRLLNSYNRMMTLMQQSASTSATLPFGELASTSGLVHPGLFYTSTAVSLGEVKSPISAVQAGAVARTNIVPQSPRILTQAHRAPSILPDVLANPEWQPTNSAALAPFPAQPGIKVETANLNTRLVFLELFFTEDLYALIVDQSNLYAEEFIAANPNSNLARPFAWKAITVSKSNFYLGLTLNMGITKKNALLLYWSTDPIHHMPCSLLPWPGIDMRV